MSEAHVLALVARYPHPSALARRAGDEALFEGLRRLQADGLVRRRGGLYRLTTAGAREHALSRAVGRLVARTPSAVRP
ncbi:MAG TPA: hypothetical protein VFR43_11430 [Gaiellaceae bacterium]|nr:hypothetical protein [Gaiellaceae bacterium]